VHGGIIRRGAGEHCGDGCDGGRGAGGVVVTLAGHHSKSSVHHTSQAVIATRMLRSMLQRR
jgi:hypothetical protein